MINGNIHAAKKVFKIDVLSKRLRLKRSTIHEWEQKFNLRTEILEAPDRLYTKSDFEIFLKIQHLKTDENASDQEIQKQLLAIKTTLKGASNSNLTVEKPKTLLPTTLPPPLKFDIQKKAEPATPQTPTTATKHNNQQSDMVTISRSCLIDLRNKALKLQKMLSQSPVKAIKIKVLSKQGPPILQKQV